MIILVVGSLLQRMLCVSHCTSSMHERANPQDVSVCTQNPLLKLFKGLYSVSNNCNEREDDFAVVCHFKGTFHPLRGEFTITIGLSNSTRSYSVYRSRCISDIAVCFVLQRSYRDIC